MMLLYKILFHFNAFIGLRLMKMVYKLWGIKLEFGTKVTYRKGFSLIIGNKGEVKIGDKVFFNNYCSLNALESITIGKGTIFGENIKVYDHNHCYKDRTRLIKEQGYTSAPIHIGEHCWIGSNTIILKGVTIGNNVVVGANCVIYKDVPSDCIVINKQNLVIKNQTL